MEFDKSRVYTAVNADEVKVGSKVIVADTLFQLKDCVYRDANIKEISGIRDDDNTNRFEVGDCDYFPICYLVSEPEEKKLKWTDLKIGDVIRNEAGTHTMMITGIDSREEKGLKPNAHILITDIWLDDDDLAYWEKVE